MILLAIVIILTVLIIYLLNVRRQQLSRRAHNIQSSQRSQRFYDVNVYPTLADIDHDKILSDVTLLQGKDWVDWPEKNLWDAGWTGASWTVFPLIAFGRKVDRNCKQVPNIMEFISRIDAKYGVKIAILSRLGAGMKLVPHQGWGEHSNSVLRCHYGVIVPAHTVVNGKSRACRIEVADEITDKCPECNMDVANVGLTDDSMTDVGLTEVGTRESVSTNVCTKCYDGYVYESRKHRTGEWIIFDDSKMHMAENTTDKDRIVLILDITRPVDIPAGTSTVEDTSELKSIIAEYEKKE